MGLKITFKSEKPFFLIGPQYFSLSQTEAVYLRFKVTNTSKYPAERCECFIEHIYIVEDNQKKEPYDFQRVNLQWADGKSTDEYLTISSSEHGAFCSLINISKPLDHIIREQFEYAHFDFVRGTWPEGKVRLKPNTRYEIPIEVISTNGDHSSVVFRIWWSGKWPANGKDLWSHLKIDLLEQTNKMHKQKPFFRQIKWTHPTIVAAVIGGLFGLFLYFKPSGVVTTSTQNSALYNMSNAVLGNGNSVNHTAINAQQYIGNVIINSESSEKSSSFIKDVSINKDMLRNGSFEEPLENGWGTGLYEDETHKSTWENFSIKQNGERISSDTDGNRTVSKDAPNGKYVLMISNRTGPKSNLFGSLSQSITLKPNTRYLLSCWLKTDNWAQNTFFLTVDRKDFHPLISLGNAKDKAVKVSGEWYQVEAHFETAINSNIDLRIVSNDFGTAYIDDIRLAEN